MSTYAKLYWLTRLDGIENLLWGVFIFLFVLIIAIILWAIIHSDFDDLYADRSIRKVLRNNWLKKIRFIAPITVVFLIMATLMPNQKEVVFIIAGGKTIEFIQSDTSMCKIPSQTTAIVSEFLNKQLKELKEPGSNLVK